MRKIIFYKTENNKSPVADFMDALNARQAKKVGMVLKLVRDLNPVPTKYLKKLTNTQNIWVVRAQAGNDIFSNGFQKKTQKTPKREIAIAEKRKKDFLIRRNNNG